MRHGGLLRFDSPGRADPAPVTEHGPGVDHPEDQDREGRRYSLQSSGEQGDARDRLGLSPHSRRTVTGGIEVTPASRRGTMPSIYSGSREAVRVLFPIWRAVGARRRVYRGGFVGLDGGPVRVNGYGCLTPRYPHRSPGARTGPPYRGRRYLGGSTRRRRTPRGHDLRARDLRAGAGRSTPTSRASPPTSTSAPRPSHATAVPRGAADRPAGTGGPSPGPGGRLVLLYRRARRRQRAPLRSRRRSGGYGRAPRAGASP